MAKEKSKYAHGKNPNSLKNLKRGFKEHPDIARAAIYKSHATQRRRKTMREIGIELAQEEQEYTLKDGTKVTKSKLEVIVAQFFKEVAKNPNAKNVLALREVLGEDVQRIEAEVKTERKYDDVVIDDDMIRQAEAIMLARQLKKD